MYEFRCEGRMEVEVVCQENSRWREQGVQRPCVGGGVWQTRSGRTAVLMESRGDWCGVRLGKAGRAGQAFGNGGWIPRALQECDMVRAVFADENVGKICVCA